MNSPLIAQIPSDTFFTQPPDWQWWIIFYFFIGGIAGGAFLIASILHLFGRPADRPLVRLGYYVAFAGAVISGVLLILDLHKPLRFWHMLFASNTGLPILKLWSPMSVGAWGLLLFGFFAMLAALGAAADENRIRWTGARRFSRSPLSFVIAAFGGLFGFFLAGYTGVLLAVTNRPVWADSPWLGVLFLVSAASTAGATLILLAPRRHAADAVAMTRLGVFDKWMLILELIVLVVFLVTLGSVAKVFLSGWGLLLLLGVIVLGIAIPLATGMGWIRRYRPAQAAAFVLVGGFLLRVVMLMSSEDIAVRGGKVIGL